MTFSTLESSRRAPDAETGNLLYDGGFEGPPLNTGFDWRISDSSDLEFDFSDPSAYKGAKCLRIEFRGGSKRRL